MAKKAKAKAASKAKPAVKAKPSGKAKSVPKAKPKTAPAAPAPKAAAKAKAAAPALTRAPGAPADRHAVTACLVVRGAAQAIDFYKHAFGAEELMRMPGPDGFSIMHAEIKIGDSILFVADEIPGAGCHAPQTINGTTASIHLYVEDVDKTFKHAVEAGATAAMTVDDMFWGDRFGQVVDPFGHRWGLATHKEDVSLAEMGQRAQAFFGKMANQPPA